MKRIIYKAKTLDNKRWVHGSLILPTIKNLKTRIVAWNGIEVEVNQKTACQFIGTYNGTDFWEGDRVLHSELGPGVIKWANTGYIVVYEDNYQIDLHEDWDELTVTGNIND